MKTPLVYVKQSGVATSHPDKFGSPAGDCPDFFASHNRISRVNPDFASFAIPVFTSGQIMIPRKRLPRYLRILHPGFSGQFWISHPDKSGFHGRVCADLFPFHIPDFPDNSRFRIRTNSDFTERIARISSHFTCRIWRLPGFPALSHRRQLAQKNSPPLWTKRTVPVHGSVPAPNPQPPATTMRLRLPPGYRTNSYRATYTAKYVPLASPPSFHSNGHISPTRLAFRFCSTSACPMLAHIGRTPRPFSDPLVWTHKTIFLSFKKPSPRSVRAVFF